MTRPTQKTSHSNVLKQMNEASWVWYEKKKIDWEGCYPPSGRRPRLIKPSEISAIPHKKKYSELNIYFAYLCIVFRSVSEICTLGKTFGLPHRLLETRLGSPLVIGLLTAPHFFHKYLWDRALCVMAAILVSNVFSLAWGWVSNLLRGRGTVMDPR